MKKPEIPAELLEFKEILEQGLSKDQRVEWFLTRIENGVLYVHLRLSGCKEIIELQTREPIKDVVTKALRST